jgi:hypothetical protein
LRPRNEVEELNDPEVDRVPWWGNSPLRNSRSFLAFAGALTRQLWQAQTLNPRPLRTRHRRARGRHFRNDDGATHEYPTRETRTVAQRSTRGHGRPISEPERGVTVRSHLQARAGEQSPFVDTVGDLTAEEWEAPPPARVSPSATSWSTSPPTSTASQMTRQTATRSYAPGSRPAARSGFWTRSNGHVTAHVLCDLEQRLASPTSASSDLCADIRLSEMAMHQQDIWPATPVHVRHGGERSPRRVSDLPGPGASILAGRTRK